ncbi:galactosyltransferase-related protein [Streptomyces sp. NPDC006173]|uniref:glycosyltransferase family 2 protein n=1 Tax=Streptomyces sp. NPDC006173 TaxID=3155349 RepID=UPI0033F7EFB6
MGTVLADRGPAARIIDCPVREGNLPLARARNLGASRALQDGADLLVFLDVDCVPGERLLERYIEVASDPAYHHALLCGTVAYLPPPGPDGYDLSSIHSLAEPHPGRPAPAPGEILEGIDHKLFWSLSFALTADTWHAIGGFCEEYEGYGGEDTDYGQRAHTADTRLLWVGGAPAFHQYHPTSSPPVGHLRDILRNAAIFQRRWGWWPMNGWLDEFADLGLIHWSHATGRWELSAAAGEGQATKAEAGEPHVPTDSFTGSAAQGHASETG